MKFSICKSYIETKYQQEQEEQEQAVNSYEDVLAGDHSLPELLLEFIWQQISL